MRAIPLLIALALAAQPLRAEEMRLSFILDESSDWYETCRVFRERVEERTGGEITVRIVTNAQLSGNSQATELEMVMSGGLEATLESSILLSNVDTAMDAFTEPWRFLSHDEAEAFADGPEGQALLGALEPHGLIGLAWGVNGFRQLTNSRGPVVTPEDLRGLRVRVPDSRQFIEIFRALGTDPVTMNFGELMMNLQTGAVEAQENPVSVIHSRRLFEVQDHLTVWNCAYDPIALCVNAAWFRGLSDEHQAILREAAREAMAAERVFSREREARLLDELRGLMEVIELTPEQVAVLRGAYAAAPTVSASQVSRVAVMSIALLILALLVLMMSASSARRAGGRSRP
jgi:TRAP-type transport system periplasmic protein